ncbi:leucine-rich repeat domain-containing protein [Paludisphaera rhizosphaerae]|uniref:hypothetical protein n=1 Tax=Paludisphaera rhizosphaerae TaxID=2711216 RepID=UPI0013ED28AC|nr:hypothetical protein [Paludisphaera rhizosphaerae]
MMLEHRQPTSGPDMDDGQPPPKRRLRLSVRALLLVVVLVGGALGWLAFKIREARAQAAIVAAIHRAGGGAGYGWRRDVGGYYYDDSTFCVPRWLVDLIGEDYFADVTLVSFRRWSSLNGPPRDLEPVMAEIGRLQRLEILDLTNSGVSDEALSHLKGLPNLQILWLEGTGVGDAGLSHLADLIHLRSLSLDKTSIRGPELAHLSSLRELELLTLRDSALTDQGMPHLAVLTGLKRLDLEQTAVTDAGVSLLVDLPLLQWLIVRQTQVGEAGLLELKESRSLLGVTVNPALFLGGNEERLREAVSPLLIN